MGTGWWTVEEIAARYGLKPSYVYRLACIWQWPRRRDGDRRVRYCGESVQAALAPGQRRTRSAHDPGDARPPGGRPVVSREPPVVSRETPGTGD